MTQAGVLGVRRETVADLVRTLGIPTYRVPLNGMARGIDAAGFRILCEALGRRAPVARGVRPPPV
jgi:hypothetical protein